MRACQTTFFARTTLAELWVDIGKVEEAHALLMRPECVLNRLYPDREDFHVSEIRHWAFVCAKIKIFMGEAEIAKGYRDMLMQIEPDSPLISYLDDLIDGEGSRYVNLLAKLKKFSEGAKALAKQ